MFKTNDLTGKILGNWTVIKRDANKRKNWICQCSCGKTRSIDGGSLSNGRSKSCGCSRLVDLTGKRFGSYVVISEAEKQNRQSRWNCLCDCGTTKTVFGSSLVSGGTVSCGCHRIKIHTTHGQTKNHQQSTSYRSWYKMILRCTHKKDTNYHRYGGRGITICDKWLKFEGFYEDMGDCQEKMSLDRINVNGNYEPNNCRWATFKEQQNNRRDNYFIEFNGLRKTLSEWSDYTGINYVTIQSRIKLLHWDVGKALTTKPTKIRH